MSKVAKTTLALMIATLIAKVLGFGRELTLGGIYGTQYITDAFKISMTIPVIIFAAIGTSLDTAFIPLYQEVVKNDGEKAANKFTNNVLNTVILICLAFSILGLIFTPQIVHLFAMGFKGETFNQAVYFTRVMILGLAFLGMSYIMTAYLQVKGNFVIPGLMSVPNNIVVITSIVLSSIINIHLLPWGALIGLVLQFLFQLPFAKKEGFKYSLFVDFNDKYLRKMLWLILPVLIGVGVNQVSNVVDKTIASNLVEGSITALDYAAKLNQFVMGMFIVSISSVVYPILANLTTQNNKEEFYKAIKTSVNTVILLLIPISLGAMILATPIVKVLFQRGAFDARSTQMTATAVIFYSIGTIGFGLRDILGKVFYSLQDTKTPMVNGIIAIILNIILNLFFVMFTDMQLAGLAFATSISAIVTIILLFISLRKKIGPFGGKSIIIVLIKSILSSLVMAVVTLFAYNFLSGILPSLLDGVLPDLLHKILPAFLEKKLTADKIYDIISLTGAVGCGALTYGIIIILLKVDEVNLILDNIKNKVKR
ncbi:murein biosynthesis integral membrane protein MurJ (plasmid) [Paraclostridium ghonii]|uniref:murein biosynthesis integral membrane protein MurJ n=1 Tax=Paraclostridium ghonii TaxID=29358 RepID=UPI00202CE4F5|nr:murein biosynthesis integral membrane protein MurJ [Paeniclostridium ghonii]MCM0167575.1 murein biosynthesis integral membrane protein MurJ [Paeniclostridium ghonii]